MDYDSRPTIPQELIAQVLGESEFQRVKRIMSEPIREPDPLNDTECEALLWQAPLPETDFLNQIPQLPSNEENEAQLHLEY